MARAQVKPQKNRDSNGWLRRGRKHEKAGDEKKAMQCYFEAFNLDPTNIVALKALSLKLVKLTERSLAIQVLERAVQANPDDSGVYLLLGNLALEMKMNEQALKFYRIAETLSPDQAIGPNNIASALRELERFDEAIALLQATLPKHPNDSSLWNTLATVVSARDGVEAGRPFYLEALRISPKMAPAWSNLARANEITGRYEEAIEAGRNAIKVDPKLTEPHYVIATAHLALGHLEEGWEEYEWRQHYRRPLSLRYTVQAKRWNGEDLTDKSIVICPEQGLGDELIFATCLPDIINKAAQCYIGCDPRLVSLYNRSFPDVLIGRYRDFSHNAQRCRDLPFLRENGIEADFYIEVGSLPKFLRRSIDDFPQNDQGYLTPDPERVNFWKDRLNALGDGPKVGIAWRSSLINNERSKHYTQLSDWGPIFDVPGAIFVNLQYDECSKEIAEAERDFGITIHQFADLDLRNDIDDGAALAKALDIVLCPAIAPAGIALTVATELWLLTRYMPWWNLGLTDSSPLGPSRFFTHNEESGWQSPIEEIAKALSDRAK